MDLIALCAFFLFMALIKAQVERRRDSIIRGVRGCQRMHRMPRRVRTFLERPRLSDEDILMAVELLGFGLMATALGLLLALGKGTFRDHVVVSLAFAFPVVVGGLLLKVVMGADASDVVFFNRGA
ncbi:hypothetical protein DL764_011058 [Monosporascus ibericus]|uniref:Uncharacterized protein n=1 Tax=Monosporascus ibericus TaxID=155417 RepID=A0A4Q4STF2_9PEZI|nr:hypothetical protein DL764_011058 [Monosporascus ibericus]